MSRALTDATFVIVGAGGLGSPLALALAFAGAGRLVLVDDDTVELSNLPRQILYRTADVGRRKVVAAQDALVRRGVPATRIEAVSARFDERSAAALLHDASVVIDGTDHPETKFLVNDAACARGIPAVVAGAVRDRGLVFPVTPGHACYRCLFEAPPTDDELGPTCADAGVLAPRCGQVAALAARVAVALVTGVDPEGLSGRVWMFDDGAEAPRSTAPRPRPDCLACHKEVAA